MVTFNVYVCVRIFISCTFAECLLYARHLHMLDTCYMPGTPLKEQRDMVQPNHYNFSSGTPGWSQWEREGLVNNIRVNCQEILLHRQAEKRTQPPSLGYRWESRKLPWGSCVSADLGWTGKRGRGAVRAFKQRKSPSKGLEGGHLLQLQGIKLSWSFHREQP